MQNFKEFEHIVTSSGSCTHHVREHLDAIPQTAEAQKVKRNTYELVEFLHDVLKVDAFPWAEFSHKVGLHNSCSTLRKLRTAKASEIDEPFFSKPINLLSKVRGLEFVTPSRPDECCGFGGTFSIFEEPVSAKMGYDKVADHRDAGAAYIVSADMSCLMHQRGCAERLGARHPLHPISPRSSMGIGHEADRSRRGSVLNSSQPRRIRSFMIDGCGIYGSSATARRIVSPEWEELRLLFS